jgi:hypothetical protein
MESPLSEDNGPKKIVEIVFASRIASITPDPKSLPDRSLTIIKKADPFSWAL